MLYATPAPGDHLSDATVRLTNGSRRKIFCVALAVIPAMLVIPGVGLAQSTPIVQYYYAQAKRINVDAGRTSPEEVLLARTLDPEHSMITEIACLRDPGRPAILSPIYMKVTGAHLQISDTPDVLHPKTVTGTGTVAGPPWHWTYLKFSMVYLPFATPVEDVNFVTPTQLIGRKQIFSPAGTPVQLYELDMDLITKAQYEMRRAQLGCPAEQ
ncbi:MAG: hypothetical protein H0U66_17600 [Gemmatimonadaceae bacterium]|nr:hypothetical protein [Gemmatimonadaceae bacterium]